MSESEKRLEKKVQFWSIIGPVIVILTVLVSLAKPNAIHLSFSIVAVMGIVCCWLWKMRGLGAAIAAITFYLLSTFSGLSSNERMWNLGMALAFVLGLVITALSLEEVGVVLRQMHHRTGELLGEKMSVEERLKASERLREERESHWFEQCRSKETERGQLADQAKSVQDEMDVLQKEKASLLQDVQGLQEQMAQLVRNLSGAEEREQQLQATLSKQACELERLRLEKVPDPEIVTEKARLNGALAALQEAARQEKERFERMLEGLQQTALVEKEGLLAELDAARKENERSQGGKEQIECELAQTAKDLSLAQEAYQTALTEREKLQAALQQLADELKGVQQQAALDAAKRSQEMALATAQLHETEEKLASLQGMLEAAKIVEKPGSEEELRHLRNQDALLKQLRRQFEEKNDVLHQTRIQIFKLEGEIFNLQREKEEYVMKDDLFQSELCDEIERLVEEKERFEKEASELSDLVNTILSNNS